MVAVTLLGDMCCLDAPVENNDGDSACLVSPVDGVPPSDVVGKINAVDTKAAEPDAYCAVVAAGN